jgi:hypothetical protein
MLSPHISHPSPGLYPRREKPRVMPSVGILQRHDGALTPHWPRHGRGAPGKNEFFGRATITLHPDAKDFPVHDPLLTIDGGKPKPWLDLAPTGRTGAVKDSGSVAYRIGKGGTTLFRHPRTRATPSPWDGPTGT